MKNNYFPDGTVIDNWFYDNVTPNINNLGVKYYINDYIEPNNNINTLEIQ